MLTHGVQSGDATAESALVWTRTDRPSGMWVEVSRRPDTVWFTTKGDNRVWQIKLLTDTYELAYDDNLVNPGTAPLTGVDNITGSTAGDLYLAEDGGNMEICMITPDDKVSTFLRITGQSGSEITGPAFTPAGDRLYFSSQRGTSGSSSGGITYGVTGPFRRQAGLLLTGRWARPGRRRRDRRSPEGGRGFVRTARRRSWRRR